MGLPAMLPDMPQIRHLRMKIESRCGGATRGLHYG